jgi:hypothetical protein
VLAALETHPQLLQVKEITAVPLDLQRLIIMAVVVVVRLLWAQLLSPLAVAAQVVMEPHRQ